MSVRLLKLAKNRVSIQCATGAHAICRMVGCKCINCDHSKGAEGLTDERTGEHVGVGAEVTRRT